MNRLTWICYFLGAALVLGSWVGLVNSELGWLGWALATGIALLSWCGVFRDSPRTAVPAAEAQERGRPFTAAEEEAARREIEGEDPA